MKIAAVLLDSGDTLVDEGSQVFGEGEVVLRAELIPGARELVQALKRRGYPLGLVADGPSATFHNVLGHHGLFEYFDVHAISEEVGVAKPAAAMFQTALRGLGIAPPDYERVVMVGNHLERDIGGANALGLISVWIDWSPRRSKIPAGAIEQPRYTIHTPLDLLVLIDRLQNAPS